ncbi:MAG: hypothetical protein ACRC9T_02080 [Vibrionaceae bacterium]
MQVSTITTSSPNNDTAIDMSEQSAGGCANCQICIQGVRNSCEECMAGSRACCHRGLLAIGCVSGGAILGVGFGFAVGGLFGTAISSVIGMGIGAAAGGVGGTVLALSSYRSGLRGTMPSFYNDRSRLVGNEVLPHQDDDGTRSNERKGHLPRE